MGSLINNIFAILILIFIISLFADPVTIARDIGTIAGETASAFADGFMNGPNNGPK